MLEYIGIILKANGELGANVINVEKVFQPDTDLASLLLLFPARKYRVKEDSVQVCICFFDRNIFLKQTPQCTKI